MKKIFITIIAMLLPLMASADVVVVEVNGINYNLNSLTKEATVAQGKYSGDINILPQVTYKGVTYTVTKINGQNFYCCGNLTSVIIPNTVTYIGMEAFCRCSSLASVTIPSSVTHIDEGAFDGCSNLSIYITDLEAWCKMYINPAAFSDGVGGQQIYYRLFVNGKEIKDLVIPSGMTSINSSVFSNCSSLTSVSIPNSATSIGNFAFSRCSNLTSVIIPNSVTSIGIWAFYNCRSLTSVTIPNSVTSIGYSAFYGCSCLTSLTIPNSVTSIGSDAFDGTGWYNNQPDGLVYAGKVAYKYKGTMPNNTSITIKDGTLGITGSAFDDCSGLTSINIPNSVTSIGNSAFYGCSDLTSITIPNSVTSIGSSAFGNCSGLTSVTIPNSVTSIGNWAFYGCNGLNSIKSLNDSPSALDDYYGSYAHFDLVDKTSCVVWVPKGSANAYKEADGWKDFQNIRELGFGDVNIDFEVNQADLDATADFIVGKDPEGFYENLADLNDDDKVDAADVVKLVTILSIQDGLSLDYQANYSNQVISSLSCTLNNDGDKAIQLTKCELYFNDELVSSSKFKVTLSTGGSKKCSFDDLASLSSKTGFSLVWYYTYNGEDYTYRCDLTE